VLARALHAAWLVRPRRPHHGRAFLVGQARPLFVLADACRSAFAG
jgi:hypothetical protein